METIHQRPFSSLSEWIDYAETPHPNDGNTDQCSSHREVSKQWTQTTSREQAFQIFRNGHPDGTVRMKSILNQINHLIKLPTLQEQITTDVEGSSPNIEAYIQGQPEDMFLFSPIEIEAPPTYLPIQLEMLTTAMTTPLQINFAGAILFAATEALKMQGCYVNCTLTHTTKSRNVPYGENEFWQSVLPLPPNLDLDTLAFLLTHPASIRTIVFATMEHEDQATRRKFNFYYRQGYGQVIPSEFKLDQCAIRIIISQITTQINPYDSALALTQSIRILQTLVDSKFQKII